MLYAQVIGRTEQEGAITQPDRTGRPLDKGIPRSIQIPFFTGPLYMSAQSNEAGGRKLLESVCMNWVIIEDRGKKNLWALLENQCCNIATPNGTMARLGGNWVFYV